MLRKIIKITLTFAIVLAISLVALGCDQSNSDAYGWDDATATPDAGDAMNAGGAPPRPTPARPTPAPVAGPTPVPTPEADAGTEAKPTPSPHVHNWEPYFEETRRNVRRTVEEVVNICNVCMHETYNQPDADSHANTLHTAITGHDAIQSYTSWGSTTVTYYRCDNCQLVFPTVAKWEAHRGENACWYDEIAVGNSRKFKCNTCNKSFDDTETPEISHKNISPDCNNTEFIYVLDPAIVCTGCNIAFDNEADYEGHINSDTPACTTYTPVTASEPVEETRYKCTCGASFGSRSKAERHRMNAGYGNPPYPYTPTRRTVEKEVEVVDRKPTDQMVCTVCGEKRDQ